MGALIQSTIFGRSKMANIFYREKANHDLLIQMYTSFSPDGTKLYATLHNGPDSVAQYSLSTPWDVTTAKYLGQSVAINQNGESQPRGHFISSDGTKLFVSGTSSSSVLYFTLLIPWDVSTASYIGSKSFGSTNSIAFSSDGLSFFNHTTFSLAKYSLSTAWDLNTASLITSQNIDFSSNSFFFDPDGNAIFYPRLNGDRSVVKILLKAPYDLSGPYTITSIDLSPVIPAINFYAVTLSPNGLKMYWSSYRTSVYEFDLSKPFVIDAKLVVI